MALGMRRCSNRSQSSFAHEAATSFIPPAGYPESGETAVHATRSRSPSTKPVRE